MKKLSTNNICCWGTLLALLLIGFSSCRPNINPGDWDIHWPMIDFSYGPSTPLIGDTVQFEALTKSYSSKITQWEWTFDSAGATGEGSHPTFVYDQPGTYKVTLKATDSSGSTDFISKTISILKDTGILIRTMVICAKPSGYGYAYDEAAYTEVADIINKYKPDFVLLRQVDSSTTRNNKIPAAHFIGEKTGLHVQFAKAFDYREGGYGNALLSRFPFSDSMSIMLPPDPAFGGEVRSMPMITVQLDDKGEHKMMFAGSELDASHEESRVAQLNNALAHIGNLAEPVIFGLNPNEHEGDQAFGLLLQQFTLACQSNGCPVNNPASNPSRTSDYIFYSPGSDFTLVRTFTVPETINQNYAPVISELRFNPED